MKMVRQFKDQVLYFLIMDDNQRTIIVDTDYFNKTFTYPYIEDYLRHNSHHLNKFIFNNKGEKSESSPSRD